MIRLTLLLLSFGLALLFEAAALGFLLGITEWQGWILPPFQTTHACGVGLIALGSFLYFPHSYRRRPFTLLALVLGFSLPAPFFGLLLLLAWGRVLKSQPPPAEAPPFVVGLSPHLTPEPELAPAMAPGATLLQILNTNDPIQRRRAILMLRHLEPERALPALRKAVQDSDEQVRLLAQNEMQRMVSYLESQAKALEAELPEGTIDVRRNLRLAEIQFELIYLNLAGEDTRPIHLNRAIQLLEAAVQADPDHGPALYLLLKCRIESNQTPQAEQLVQRLSDLGFEKQMLEPWLAEIAFLKRDWNAFTQMLQQMQEAKSCAPRMAELIEFWLGPRPSLT